MFSFSLQTQYTIKWNRGGGGGGLEYKKGRGARRLA